MKKFLIAFLASASGLFLSNSAMATTNYMAVVDGGSTGSRLYLYTYDPDSTNTLKLPTLINSAKVQPGIATLDPSQIATYLAPLFQMVQKDIPSGISANLYFLSTAGMRLLSFDQQQAIYSVINTSATKAGLTPVVSKTITGQMEGVFDWININALLNTLGQPQGQTSGVLDLGGASTEISFAGNGNNINPDDLVTLSLANQTYTLYSHSYLGLGENEAQGQYMNAAECYPVDYNLPNEHTGTGDFHACQSHVASLLDPVQNVKNIQSLIPTNTNMPFYATSGFAYITTSKIFNLGSQLSTQSLKTAAINSCAQTWDLLNQEDPSDPYLYATCFDAALAINLLNSYGFSPNQILTATNAIGNTDIDWALGAAIYYLNPQG